MSLAQRSTLGKALPASQWRWPFSSTQNWLQIPGMLGLHLSSLIPERQGHSGARLVRQHKGAAFDLCEKAERARTIQPGGEKAPEGSYITSITPNGRDWRRWSKNLLSGAHCKDKSLNETKNKTKNPSEQGICLSLGNLLPLPHALSRTRWVSQEVFPLSRAFFLEAVATIGLAYNFKASFS